MELLFVCTGNTCRSPMAEVCCRDAAKRAGIALEASSAGLCACDGASASENARKAVAEIGLSLEGFRSRGFSSALAEKADWIVCLGRSHARAVKAAVPSAAAKIRLLSPEDNDIADPFGGGLDTYRACRDEIRGAVERLIHNI